jgi:hypothetical protein
VCVTSRLLYKLSGGRIVTTPLFRCLSKYCVLLVIDLLLYNIAYLFDTDRSRLNVNNITLVLISVHIVQFMHRRESR